MVLSVVDVPEPELVATVDALVLVTAVEGVAVEELLELVTADAVVAGEDVTVVEAVVETLELELVAVADDPVPEAGVAEASRASKVATLSSKTCFSIRNRCLKSSAHNIDLSRSSSRTFSTALRRSTSARSLWFSISVSVSFKRCCVN